MTGTDKIRAAAIEWASKKGSRIVADEYGPIVRLCEWTDESGEVHEFYELRIRKEFYAMVQLDRGIEEVPLRTVCELVWCELDGADELLEPREAK